VPGNPGFICTLWFAEYDIMMARTLDDLKPVLDCLEWCRARALRSGVLAEQVHPMTGMPLSVSPLTWSHSTLVGVVDRYLVRRREILAALAPREQASASLNGHTAPAPISQPQILGGLPASS
jgi:hypothetical protein